MNTLKHLVLMASLAGVAACSSTPAGDWVDKLNPFSGSGDKASTQSAPANVALPIKNTLLVYMSPRDLARQSRILATSGNSEYWLQEGMLTQQAALRGLARLFERVSPGTEPFGPTPVATVTSISGFNPTLGTQSANVTVTFTLQSESPIGKLRAKGYADGYDQATFAKALDAAFQEIQVQFLKDGALVTALVSPPEQPRVAAVPTQAAPPAAAAPPPQPAAAAAIAPQSTALAPAAAAPPPQPAAAAAIAPQSAALAPAAAAIQLPIKRELGIFLTAETLARQSYVNNGYSSYWLKEGNLIQAAAVKAFGKLFERVSVVEEGKARYPLVRVDGRSSFNAALGTRSAIVFADFFSPGGQRIATLTARSSAEGPGEAGFEAAYDAAFRDIQQQFFENGALTAAFAGVSSDAAPQALSPPPGSPPPSTAPVAASAGIPIPNNGSLILYMAPEELSRQTVIPESFGYASNWVEEGKIVQRAATKAFGRIFAQGVHPAARGVAPGPLLKVKGSSSFNPIMKTFSSSVVASFSSSNGASIGEFEGKATVDAGGSGEAGLERAYDAAFQVIVKQLLAAGKL